MGGQRGGSWTGSPPEVSNRLYTVIVMFFGLLCLFAGYLLGHRSLNVVKRTNDMFNLTVAAENVYQKARRIPPKAVYHNGAENVTAKILAMFHCNENYCGTINNKQNLAGLVRNCINNEVHRMMGTLYNATMFLDSLK